MTKILLDPSIYAVEAVQKAAYRFIDRCAVHISHEDAKIICQITFNENLVDQSEAIIADFQKELLDQQLRYQIKLETTDVRNLILSLAFSKSGLQG